MQLFGASPAAASERAAAAVEDFTTSEVSKFSCVGIGAPRQNSREQLLLKFEFAGPQSETLGQP